MRVLQLLGEHPLARIEQAVETCRVRGTPDAAAVAERRSDCPFRRGLGV